MANLSTEPKNKNRESADPVVIAIDAYWKSLEEWRAANRKVKRLKKKFSADLVRQPRVQMSFLLREKNEAGVDIKEPIFVHSEWEIKNRIKEELHSMLLTWAGPSWVSDPKAKNGLRRIITERAERQHPIIRAKYKLREKTKIAEFLSDRAELYAQQRAVGWRQAVETEQELRMRVYNLRYKAKCAKPATLKGATALIEFISAAYRAEAHSRDTRAPYGLGSYYTAHIASKVANFLKQASR